MNRALRPSRNLRNSVFIPFLLMAATAVYGQVVPVPAKPVVGSSNPATAEPPVARPTSTPCTVTLLDNQEFGDYSAKPMNFTPPTSCAGPWAKVVLTIDFTVTAGRQYDRTASFYLGNSNIFYGTTAEPRSTLSPSWHVEKDVTDLSPIFKTAQTGQAIVYNIVNSTYTGIIYGSAKLLFYPANHKNPAPEVPSVVVPVSGVNSPFELDTTSSQVTATFTAPRNTEKAYLDLIAQSQSNDEFWYFCVPSEVSSELESCGNTAFRESEITIDGKPAGVAPVYPWIFTGGLDPYLWEPITGVQTLNFKPYRVDLTPFAGVLSDGASHTVGVSVFNANSYFEATGNLLLYTDAYLSQTVGALEEDTLSAAPTPVVNENLTTDPTTSATTGTVTVTSARNFMVKGYVNTAHGKVETTVEQTIKFDSMQTFDVGSNDVQDAIQTSTVNSKTTTQLAGSKTITEQEFSFPLKLNYSFVANTDGTYTQVVTSSQQFRLDSDTWVNGRAGDYDHQLEQVNSTDTLDFDAGYNVTGVGPTKSSAKYVERSPNGCFDRTLTSSNRVLTKVTTSDTCIKE